jgi:hypothetical protein
MTVALAIDRLSLRIAGITEADGQRLVQLVGEHLAAAPTPAFGAATDAMRLRLDARRGEALEATAQRIAAAMRRGMGAP